VKPIASSTSAVLHLDLDETQTGQLTVLADELLGRDRIDALTTLLVGG
jgi:hypothetical protein